MEGERVRLGVRVMGEEIWLKGEVVGIKMGKG